MRPEIRFFKRDRARYPWLSNFYPAPIQIEGSPLVWPTAEHMYQALKTDTPDERLKILCAATPGQAKRIGRTVTIHPGWETVKIAAMRIVVAEKFQQHPDLARLLMETGDALLIEDNPHDAFWGTGRDGQGRNELGRILMDIRRSKHETD